MDRTLIGPPLLGARTRGPWTNRDRLASFIRNPPLFIGKSCYTREQQREYGSIMTSFAFLEQSVDTVPSYSGSAIDRIIDYMESEDFKAGIPQVSSKAAACADSCWRYDSLTYLRSQAKVGIRAAAETVDYFLDTASMPYNETMDSVGLIDSLADISQPVPDLVERQDPASEYYDFQIYANGWSNIDCMPELSTVQSRLAVTVRATEGQSFAVYLAIPALKVFSPGGLIDGSNNTYGFYTKDGKTNIPQGTEVIVFAVGERNGEILYEAKRVTLNGDTQVTLGPTSIAKETFEKKVRLIDKDIVAEAQSTIEGIQIPIPPQQCDCGCREK